MPDVPNVIVDYEETVMVGASLVTHELDVWERQAQSLQLLRERVKIFGECVPGKLLVAIFGTRTAPQVIASAD
jgi:hypothetical protein